MDMFSEKVEWMKSMTRYLLFHDIETHKESYEIYNEWCHSIKQCLVRPTDIAWAISFIERVKKMDKKMIITTALCDSFISEEEGKKLLHLQERKESYYE